ncbi:hypothetical protein TEA_003679 [Camellia sinensis var. sinensis]|uniref:Uncharacterized protein n=1 Tax=Camellia sinensis var. sinensis TaxID=542762 RepID=A0A4S4EY39_CAMSN|nr:hypothetical protein TEA_003679 [Camellia sinensis var. sinensis]
MRGTGGKDEPEEIEMERRGIVRVGPASSRDGSRFRLEFLHEQQTLPTPRRVNNSLGRLDWKTIELIRGALARTVSLAEKLVPESRLEGLGLTGMTNLKVGFAGILPSTAGKDLSSGKQLGMKRNMAVDSREDSARLPSSQ